MGFRAGTLSALTLTFLLAVFGAAHAQEMGTRAQIRSFTMPQYHERDGKLQFIVYGADADNKGALLTLDDLVVDFMRDDLEDVSKVKILANEQAYDLNASRPDVLKFWSDKPHSQGLVFSDSAVLDKNTQVLRSDGKVHFRSSFIDVDGVGFDAYQDRKFLHIRSQVVLKIRPEARKKAEPGQVETHRTAETFFEQEIKQQSHSSQKENRK